MSAVLEKRGTMKIAKISRIDTTDLLWELKQHPDLWNQNTARTEHPDSPHHGLDDIWARYAPPDVDGSQPHKSVWYTSPITPALRDMAERLMTLVHGTELGGVLITRIPAGCECKPHTDPGWHARYYEKIAVQVCAAPGQAFHFDDQKLATRPGDVFWFDNAHRHWVTNPTLYPRVTAIFCIKTSAFDTLKEGD
jgi:hypothetical protein